MQRGKQREEEGQRKVGGSPGLVVMGGNSCSKGCKFEYRHRILDGHFSHLFQMKINEKEAGVCPFFKKIQKGTEKEKERVYGKQTERKIE